MTGVKATTNKVVPNHGKPNCAPKPPGIQHIVSAHKNGLSPLNTVNSTTTNNGNINRPIVSRAHSMRSPRFVHRPIFDKIHTHTYTPQNRLNFKKLISVSLLVFGAELAEALIAHKLQTNDFSFFFQFLSFSTNFQITTDFSGWLRISGNTTFWHNSRRTGCVSITRCNQFSNTTGTGHN